MSGILFLRTGDLERTAAFYIARLDCRRWLDQPGCVILRHDNFLFGLCARERPQTDVLLTFFYDTPAEVDRLYARHRDTADGPPRLNETYRIYQFFARDPEGRGLEFQHFADPVAQFRSGDDLLATRRSVREFAPDPVPDDVIERIIESCRFAPSAWNRQPQCYRIIRDPETLRYLAASRQEATAPIGRAPAAVAVSVDTTVSPYPAVDGA
ncbi:MAG TPA: nitroreductase family protein, partial [candidate division Zixibacteria bacterium]|nr:nitroreductase family protein [candidate division Zixibacteria bacterium]